MILNRSTAPAFKTIDKIDVIKAKHLQLNNGIDFYSLSAGSQEIVRIEFDDNWGDEEKTEIYRVRIHGRERN